VIAGDRIAVGEPTGRIGCSTPPEAPPWPPGRESAPDSVSLSPSGRSLLLRSADAETWGCGTAAGDLTARLTTRGLHPPWPPGTIVDTFRGELLIASTTACAC